MSNARARPVAGSGHSASGSASSAPARPSRIIATSLTRDPRRPASFDGGAVAEALDGPDQVVQLVAGIRHHLVLACQRHAFPGDGRQRRPAHGHVQKIHITAIAGEVGGEGDGIVGQPDADGPIFVDGQVLDAALPAHGQGHVQERNLQGHVIVFQGDTDEGFLFRRIEHQITGAIFAQTEVVSELQHEIATTGDQEPLRG
jgi:hypothetical protein